MARAHGLRRALTALAGLALLASVMPAAHAEGGADNHALCSNADSARVSADERLPVQVCLDGESNVLVVRNDSPYWVSLRIPAGVALLGLDLEDSTVANRVLAEVSPAHYLPPDGEARVQILLVNTARLSFGAEGVWLYSFAEALVSAFPLDEGADIARTVALAALEIADAGERYFDCVEAGNFVEDRACVVPLAWDVNFAVGRAAVLTGISSVKALASTLIGIVEGSLVLVEDFHAAADNYYDTFTVTPVQPNPPSDGGDEPAPVIPVTQDNCSPPVPSGLRGIADTTRYSGDPCSGVYVRDGASLSASRLGELAQGTVFPIVCQVRGEPIYDSTGYTSDVWNRVEVNGLSGLVQDTWSGRKGWLDVPCDASGTSAIGGCSPAVPTGQQGVSDTTHWDADPCSGVYLRSAPANWNTIVREIPQATVFPITCQTRGEVITDSRGYASDVWNKTIYDGLTGWVADTWSGHRGWLDVPCGEPTGCSPAVPPGNRGVSDTTHFAGDPCSGVFVREGPTLGHRTLTEIPQGTEFDIHCQAHGENIYDATGYESTIWNKTTYNGITGWVQDVWSGRKGWLELSCDALPPAAPDGLTVTSADGALALGWAEPAGNGGRVLSYELEVLDGAGAVVRPVTATGTTTTVDGLDNGVPYRFRVRALNHKGAGAWSVESSDGVPAGVPWQAGVPALTVVDGAVDVRWAWASAADNGAALEGFDVELDADAVTSHALAPEQEGFVLFDADEGAPMQARVRARGAVGAGEWSDWSPAVAVPARPAAVGPLDLEPLEDGLRVAWTAVDDAERYEVTTSHGTSVVDTTATAVVLGSAAADDAFVAVRAVSAEGQPGEAVSARNPRATARVDGGGGDDPVAQAIATSQVLFQDGAATRVVLATAARFPDALAGASLAGTEGPILVTPGNRLDDRVADEIARVTGGSGQVLILGGTAALTEDVASAARAAAGDQPCAAPLPPSCRYAGTGREHTAALIAETVLAEHEGGRVLVARGDEFADSITGGAYAARTGTPILLTPPDMPNASAMAFIAEHDLDEVVVLGGTAAVDATTAASLGATGRVAGPERTATAAAIADGLWDGDGLGAGGVVLVNVRAASGWQTALSAAVASAILDAPQLGVENPPAEVGSASLEHLRSHGGPVSVFGGHDLVSEAQAAQARAAARA